MEQLTKCVACGEPKFKHQNIMGILNCRYGSGYEGCIYDDGEINILLKKMNILTKRAKNITKIIIEKKRKE